MTKGTTAKEVWFTLQQIQFRPDPALEPSNYFFNILRSVDHLHLEF